MQIFATEVISNTEANSQTDLNGILNPPDMKEKNCL